jgi:hypothetical protein
MPEAVGLFSLRPVVHPWLAPVAIRYVLVADPEGQLRMEAFFCTDLEATPAQILEWAIMRWSVEVTFQEERAHLGLETQRQWSDRAIARTTPVLLGLFSLVTVLALRLSEAGHNPVPMTAWYHTAEPTFGLSGLGAPASLACPVLRELRCEARVRAIPSGGFRPLAHRPLVSGLVGQSRV